MAICLNCKREFQVNSGIPVDAKEAKFCSTTCYESYCSSLEKLLSARIKDIEALLNYAEIPNKWRRELEALIAESKGERLKGKEANVGGHFYPGCEDSSDFFTSDCKHDWVLDGWH